MLKVEQTKRIISVSQQTNQPVEKLFLGHEQGSAKSDQSALPEKGKTGEKKTQ